VNGNIKLLYGFSFFDPFMIVIHLLLDPLELIEKLTLLIPPRVFTRCAFPGCSRRTRRGGRR
jgi:hypothetical protein